MFIGHFGVGFGAKRAAPAVSLGMLFLACQLADLIWPDLVLLGVERVEIAPGATAVTPLDFVSYPYSHGLATLALWGAALGLIYHLVRRGDRRAPLTLALVVVSHWLLDFVSHRPDMPLAPGLAERYGLGLWNSVAATVVVETVLFAAGIALYLRATAARDRTGVVALWSLVVFLYLVSLANLFGPPPPSVGAVAWVAQSLWLVVAWGFWVDRHRVARAPAPAP
ncbi:MAG: hypothetical protein AB7G12_03625 [Thermoanaerobaculia bacterium]